MRFLEFRPWHVGHFALQEGDAVFKYAGLFEDVCELSDVWTGFDGDGRVVGMAGILPVHYVQCTVVPGVELPKEAAAWAIFSGPLLAKHAKSVVRFVRTVLAHRPEQRIAAEIDLARPNAARFAEAVGLAYAGNGIGADGQPVRVHALQRDEWPIQSLQPLPLFQPLSR